MTDWDADYATEDVPSVMQADFTTEGGGGGGGCPPGQACLPADYVAPCDYRPYCINLDPTDPDTVIMALSPWGYWKCQDASGAPQDSSGNGRHASLGGAGSWSYHQPALSAKTGFSIKANNHTSAILFPVLVAKMSDFSLPFTILGLAQFDDTSDGNPNGSIFISEMQTSTATMFGQYFQANSDLWLIVNQAAVATMDSLKPGIGAPFAWAIKASGFDVTVYINGVVAQTGFRGSASYSEISWSVGVNGFFSNPLYHVSNVAAWDSALSEADIIAIHEALMDDAIAAAATVIV